MSRRRKRSHARPAGSSTTAASIPAMFLDLDVDLVLEPGDVRGSADRAPAGLGGRAARLSTTGGASRPPVPFTRSSLLVLELARRPPARSRRDAGGGAAGAGRGTLEEAWLGSGRRPQASLVSSGDDAWFLRRGQLATLPGHRPRVRSPRVPRPTRRIESAILSLNGGAMGMVKRGEIREGKTLVALLLEARRRSNPGGLAEGNPGGSRGRRPPWSKGSREKPSAYPARSWLPAPLRVGSVSVMEGHGEADSSFGPRGAYATGAGERLRRGPCDTALPPCDSRGGIPPPWPPELVVILEPPGCVMSLLAGRRWRSVFLELHQLRMKMSWLGVEPGRRLRAS